MSCEHENAGYIQALDPVGEIYLCHECGGLVNIADSATGFGERTLSATEISDLIEQLVNHDIAILKDSIRNLLDGDR